VTQDTEWSVELSEAILL